MKSYKLEGSWSLIVATVESCSLYYTTDSPHTEAVSSSAVSAMAFICILHVVQRYETNKRLEGTKDNTPHSDWQQNPGGTDNTLTWLWTSLKCTLWISYNE
jgi:hypothetical protein